MSQEPQIKNIEDIEAMLRERLAEISYISISEKVGGRESQLVRLDMPELERYQRADNWSPIVEEQLELLHRELFGMPEGHRSSYQPPQRHPARRAHPERTRRNRGSPQSTSKENSWFSNTN